jgi:predicted transcriptional regulator
MESSKRKQREPGVPSEALTVRLPVELTVWLRETAYTQRRSQALIIEEALTRYRESG